MTSLLTYGIIFFGILIIGIGFVLYMRRRNNKKAARIPVTLFQRTATGLKVIDSFGVETVENTQKMLDIASINRKFNFPTPTAQIFGSYLYIQTDEITWRLLVLRTDLPISIQLESLSKKLKAGDKLTKEEIKDLTEYLEAEKLKPEIDPAFRHIYANNVEKIIKATAVEDDSIWAKLSKFMPVIMIVATCVGMVLLLYAYVPFFNAAISHVTLTCTNGAAPVTTPANTTLKPPNI